jgi:hypothetical protein
MTDNTGPMKRFAQLCDARLKGKPIMITADNIVLVLIDRGWHVVRDDFAVLIELAPALPEPDLPEGVHKPLTLPPGVM